MGHRVGGRHLVGVGTRIRREHEVHAPLLHVSDGHGVGARDTARLEGEGECATVSPGEVRLGARRRLPSGIAVVDPLEVDDHRLVRRRAVVARRLLTRDVRAGVIGGERHGLRAVRTRCRHDRTVHREAGGEPDCEGTVTPEGVRPTNRRSGGERRGGVAPLDDGVVVHRTVLGGDAEGVDRHRATGGALAHLQLVTAVDGRLGLRLVGDPDTLDARLAPDLRQVTDLEPCPGPNTTARDGFRERSGLHALGQLDEQHDAAAEVARGTRSSDLADQLDLELPLAQGVGVSRGGLLLELLGVGLADLHLLALADEASVGGQHVVHVTLDGGGVVVLIGRGRLVRSEVLRRFRRGRLRHVVAGCGARDAGRHERHARQQHGQGRDACVDTLHFDPSSGDSTGGLLQPSRLTPRMVVSTLLRR